MTMTKVFILTIVAAYAVINTLAFAPSRHHSHVASCHPFVPVTTKQVLLRRLSATPEEQINDGSSNSDAEQQQAAYEVEQKRVGNLIADEEWAGITMELAEIIKTAVVEDLKKNSRDFLGKDDYAVGDFSKEVDKRVKAEVAKIREKDDYELGDLSVVLDDKVKELVCQLSGKDEYEFGDLSVQIDIRAKEMVAKFCGKEKYEFGDLSKEVAKRTKEGVLNITGKSDYKFGDLTMSALKNLSGKDDYQFGDVTKKLMGNLFKKDKK